MHISQSTCIMCIKLLYITKDSFLIFLLKLNCKEAYSMYNENKTVILNLINKSIY